MSTPKYLLASRAKPQAHVVGYTGMVVYMSPPGAGIISSEYITLSSLLSMCTVHKTGEKVS